MSRSLQLELHHRIETAAALLDLQLTAADIERLALELTGPVRAMIATAGAEVVEQIPVAYVPVLDPAAERQVSEWAGCVSAIHPAIAEDSPAALLAVELRRAQSDLVSTDVFRPVELALTVRPRSLRAWEWWLQRMHVDTATVQRTGATVTGTGSYGEVTVHLTGQDVGALLDDQAAEQASARLSGLLAGHPW